MNFPHEPSSAAVPEQNSQFGKHWSIGEQRLRALFHTTSQIFWVTNADGVAYPEECGSWLDYTGQTVAEFQGTGWLQALHPDDREQSQTAWSHAVQTRSLFQAEYRLRRHDGCYRYFVARGVPLLDEDGHIREWVGTCTDISDRRQIEETMLRSARNSECLRKSLVAISACEDLEAALKCLLEQVIMLGGLDSGAVFTIEGEKAQLQRHHGLPPEFVAIVSCRSTTSGYVEKALRNPEEILNVVEHFPENLELYAKFGLHHVYCIPLVTEQESFGFVTVSSHGVSPPSAAELELVRILTWETEALLTRLITKQRYRSVLTAMAEGIVVQLADGRITDCNPSAEKILGLSREQIMGRKSIDPRWRAVHEDGRPFPGEDHPAMVSLRTGQPCHNIVMGLHLPDRSQRWLNINSEPMFHSGATKPYAVVTTFDDITERTLAVKRLQESEGQLRHVGDNLPLGMVYQLLSHADGRRKFLYVSAGVERLHGVTAEMVLQDATLLYQQIHEEDRAYVAAKEAECSQTLGSFSAQVRSRRPNGELRWIQLSSAPTLLENGSIRWDGLETDITEAKRMEEHLRQSQKMEGIGHLAGGVAHEFNNILAALMPSLEMIKSTTTEAETLEMLQEMEGLTRRAAELVKQMLAFSRQSVMNSVPFDLAAEIPVQIKMLKRLLGERITIEFSTPRDLPWVNGDQNLIAQVLMNLSLNARDAMNGVGRLRLGLEEIEVSAAEAKILVNVHSGKFICLSVMDSGCGMDKATLDHLFEPFFTTKEVGHGTGLGLATVQGIVQQHHGWVQVTSYLGSGSTFRIYLPTAEKQSPLLVVPKAGMVAGQGTILLVDDETSVRLVTRKLLVRMGYVVLEAAHGQEALTLWERHQQEIDLLLTDMVMPGDVNGLQLAEHLLEAKPKLKVIITSGYNNDIFELDKLADAAIVYLPKPCEPATLTTVIHSCLNAQPPA